MGNEKKFSPVRVTAASEEAAVQQALAMTGAVREDIEVEILGRNEKGVTIRVLPRSENAGQPSPQAQSNEVAPVSAAPIDAAPVQDSDVQEEDAAPREAVAEAEEAPENELPAPPQRTAAPVDPALQERARSLAQEFLDRMGLEAEAQIAEPFSPLDSTERVVPRVYVQIEGEDVGVLIGKHGQTLQSFQYLLNLTLNNNIPAAADNASGDNAGDLAGDVGLHVVVDAGGYRVRRASALDQMARDAASRAKRERRAVRLEPMPAHERRLIHISLREDSEITSGSEGQEPMRRVIVAPAGMRAGGDERNRFGQGQRGSSGGSSGRSSAGGYGGPGRGGPRGGSGGRGGRSDSR
ncbi:MAG TPA: R3H domain-containing nucleic acid-binding protein [Abditibacteriaceae bacterium]|nr:R3H domain-containing nucleic acid-binding protein [Abditibacteriaceae bacterium]